MSDYANIFSNSWGLLIVLLFFGGSIFVHEFGHFLAAKMCGLKVLRFSIGFGPRLFSWRGRDGCKYMVSLFPLGGYVALPQLADMGALEGGEESDAQNTKSLPKASFSAKVIVSAAGAFFNLIFAAILATIVWHIGLPTNSLYRTNQIGWVSPELTGADGEKIPSPAKLAGLRSGDKILTIDDKKIENFSDIVEAIALGSGRDEQGKPLAVMQIERDGKNLEVLANPALVKTNVATGDAIRMLGVSPAMKMVVASVMKNSPAEKAGVKIGDEVVGIDGVKLYSQQQLAEILDKRINTVPAKVEVLRNGKAVFLTATPVKIARTKALSEISISDGGKIEFINSQSNGCESVKVFSKRIDNPFFSEIKAGDILYSVANKKISTIQQLNAIVNGSENTRLQLAFISPNMQMKDVSLPAGSHSKIIPAQEQAMLGYSINIESEIQHPTIIEQFKDSILRTYSALASLLNPKSDVGISSLAGPVDIGRVIYKLSLQDISLVLSFAVLLNVNLAFLNLLPIPVLDGGHILFATISKITGRAIPASVFGAIQGFFSLAFISLMLYIVYIGFMRWSGDSKMETSDTITSEFYIKNIDFEKK